jgi:hypothetical protein
MWTIFMNEKKKYGIIFILVGCCAVIISTLLSSGYIPTGGYLYSIRSMETVLKEGQIFHYPQIAGAKLRVDLGGGRIVDTPGGLEPQETLNYIKNTYDPSFFDRITGNSYTNTYYYKGRIAIPYKYCLSVEFIIIFIGIGLFLLAKSEKDKLS